MFDQARPGSEILPCEVIEAFAEARKARGRPRLLAPKVSVKLRLDPDIVTAYRATGRNWQTRINADLRRMILASPAQPATLPE
jgi:uncharacterized protein (DUF4415 family)